MKQVLILLFATFAVGNMSFAQTDCSKKCTPTEACAKKMGMTLEECKALCKKACAKSATVEATKAESAPATLVSTEGQVAEKPTCNIEECARALGISVEEYKARCKKACANSATVEATKAKSTTATLVSTEGQVAEKPACNIEECARALGISVEECRKLCKPSNCKSTAVASAVMTKAEDSPKKKCAKSKACTKSKE